MIPQQKPAEIRAIRGEAEPGKNKWRQVLYVVTVPLLLAEWFLDLIVQIVDTIRKSVETLTLAGEKYINEPIKPKP